LLVSVFFTFYGEANLTTDALRSLMAEAVGGTISPDGFIFREGMDITALCVADDDDDESTGAYFGFTERVSVTFNFHNLAGLEVTDRNTALMVAAVLAVFDADSGRGVLLYNGSQVVLQRLDDGVEFDSEWMDWSQIAETAPFLERYPSRPLNQPLL
jgi:hypothetical protein